MSEAVISSHGSFDPLILLASHGLRQTRPRIQIAKVLFQDSKNRHVTADWVAEKLAVSGEQVALATVYNTLNRFVEAGLLREIYGAPCESALFDTNVAPHHHVLDETTGELLNLPAEAISLDQVNGIPDDKEIVGVDIVVRVRNR